MDASNLKTKLLLGGSGTGKTTELLKELKRLIETGVPNGKILWVAYNALTVIQTSKAITKLEISGSPVLTTFPGLCAGLLRGFHRQLGFSTPPQLIGFKDREIIWNKANARVNETLYVTDPNYQFLVEKAFFEEMYNENKVGGQDLARVILSGTKIQEIQDYWKRFEIIILDDAQDYLPSELDLLNSIHCKKLIAADVNGLTSYQSSCNKLQSLINASNVSHLTTNFRSKKWVCLFANQLAEYNEFRNPYEMQAFSTSNMSSQIYAFQLDDQNHQHNWLAHQVINCLNAKPDITIGIICRGVAEAVQVGEGLKKANIPINFIRLRNRLDTSITLEHRVTVSTANDVKGMEFSVVIMPTATEGNWPIFGERDICLTRRQFLTSASRAKSMVLFGIPQVTPNGKKTYISRFIKEGNMPELVVHGKSV